MSGFGAHYTIIIVVRNPQNSNLGPSIVLAYHSVSVRLGASFRHDASPVCSQHQDSTKRRMSFRYRYWLQTTKHKKNVKPTQETLTLQTTLKPETTKTRNKGNPL